MRKSNQQTIGQILDQFIRENNLAAGLTQAELSQRWAEITGEFIARHTLELKIIKQILFVTMDNSACKQELSYKKSEVLARVNLLTPKNPIRDIYIR